MQWCVERKAGSRSDLLLITVVFFKEISQQTRHSIWGATINGSVGLLAAGVEIMLHEQCGGLHVELQGSSLPLLRNHTTLSVFLSRCKEPSILLL